MESTSQLLAQHTFLQLPISTEQRLVISNAYSAWDAFFASDDRFLMPGEISRPSGFVPLCLARGCELKESFYLRSEMSAPIAVRGATDALVSLLSDIAVMVAAELNEGAGSRVVRYPGSGCLRIMRYPAFDGEKASSLMNSLAAAGQLRAGPHTDLNALTILAPASAPGLEIDGPDGWMSLKNESSMFLVHAGRELEARTAGRWRATVHRVRNPLLHELRLARLSCAHLVS